MRSPMIIIGVVLAAVLAGIGFSMAVPRLQHALVGRSVAWPSSDASFRVLKIIPQKSDNKPSISLHCRWDDPNGASRFALSFPEKEAVVYPDGKIYSPVVSPLGRRDFVFRLYLLKYPSLLSSVTVAMTCTDQKSGSRDLGQRTLQVRYWPSNEPGIPVNTIQ